MPAGGPSQAKLIELIFKLPNRDSKTGNSKERFKKFLNDVLGLNKKAARECSLEDVYTPIDRCLADGVSLRSISREELQQIRSDLEYLISLAIDHEFRKAPTSASEYLDLFAKHLVRLASIRAEKAKGAHSARDVKSYDPFAVISLNWDIALDKRIYKELIRNDGGRSGDYDPIGVVDYCCYISSVERFEERVRPGLWALGARGYNVKLLKPHGSMNWLQCSNCQRLFVGFDEKIVIPNYINAETCRHCSKFGIDAKLHGSLVMPTFLKDLSNFQIKLVWQNTGVELMEATKLVFIGYSLPYADFEFRQLLSRMVQRNAAVHVVLKEGPGTDGARRYEEECSRYRQFFGNREVTFESGGVQEFVRSLTAKIAAV